MGRVATVNASCQICGGVEIGGYNWCPFSRHYGLFACDGCACFWKRTIRRNIQYQCISGEGNCPVDKTRRNWCPACRLRKCEEMQMNKHAVQKERGPRSERAALRTQNFKKPNNSNVQTANFLQPVNQQLKNRLQLLLVAMQKSLESTVINFLSVEQKKAIVEKFWPKLVLLNAPNFPQISFEMDAVNEIVAKCQNGEWSRMDTEETRLLFCIFFCRAANQLDCIAFAGPLLDSYEYWLTRHCLNYYPKDEGRKERMINFLDTVINFDGYENFVKSYFQPSPQ